MSHMIMDCPGSLNKLFTQVDGVFRKHGKHIQQHCRSIVKLLKCSNTKAAHNTSELNNNDSQLRKFNGCDYSEIEIQLIVEQDKAGKLFRPSYDIVEPAQSKVIISPASSPEKIQVTPPAKVKYIIRRSFRKRGKLMKDFGTPSCRKSVPDEHPLNSSNDMMLSDREIPRLDYKVPHKVEDISFVLPQGGQKYSKQEDCLSTCDSGYSDAEGPRNSITESDDDDSCSTPLKNCEDKCRGIYTRHDHNNPCLPTPSGNKTPFRLGMFSGYTSTNDDSLDVPTIDLDMTDVSLNDTLSSIHLTSYGQATEDANDLESEIHAVLVTPEEADDTCVDITTQLQLVELKDTERQLIGQIDRRREELNRMIDSWHQKIKKDIKTAYENERKKIERASKNPVTQLVPGVCSPKKSMCTVLNTRNHIQLEDLGTFSHAQIPKHRIAAERQSVSSYVLNDPKHLRTFETRSTDTLDSDYMATGLDIDQVTGLYLVTDMGADTCRMFSPTGQMKMDVDLEPLSEPTKAVIDGDNITVCCRNSLKLYQTSNDNTHHMIASADIKSPQCVCLDSTGNFVISDKHDCGAVIVTIERTTHLPVRMMCGSEYTGQGAFNNAWYIHITRDNHIILSDRDNHTVNCYTSQGHFKWSTGGWGARAGQFLSPAGITEDRVGNILVADHGNNRVQILSSEGEWLGVVISHDKNNDFIGPMDLCIDAQGNLVVLLANGIITVYSYLQANK